MSFRREPTVQQWIAGNTVPSKKDNLEGVTTNLVNMPERVDVKFVTCSAVHPLMDEEIV